MKYGSLILEKKEFVNLQRLLNLSGNHKDASRKNSVLRLKQELESASVYEDEEMPEDVVRFNSEVTVGSADGWENSFQLVEPSESNYSEKKISVLTAMGLAVMGYAQGDIIDWEFPGGVKSLEIKEVKQRKTESNQI
ncbi:MAG TPA: GreA/GreB family elongation factor [Xanthomarina sp.]|nr:GreA/GreB family elongation factor [Xanthomarina sp.]